MVIRYIGSHIYWLVIFIDLIFWGLIKYFYMEKGLTDDEYWYWREVVLLFRILLLWGCVMLNFRYRIMPRNSEIWVFGAYIVLMFAHSVYWCIDNLWMLK